MGQVIARRYRPQSFEEVIGQEPIIRTLHNAIESGRIAHGFIFSGHRGIGKTTVARILAKALNCRAGAGPTTTPCGECDSCREIREGSAVDVIEIDAASNRGIDEIRALRERVRYRPARDRYKFFILDEAHQLTGDAFNALLKTLEEPPEWAVFVLATTEPEALPPTIRSRCQHFAFRAVPFAAILTHLAAICEREQVPAESEALGLIAEAGEGSVRDALSLLDQAITHSAQELNAEAVRALLGRVSSAQIRELLQAVAENSAREVLQRTDALLAAGVGPAPLCWQLTQAVRNTLVAQSAPELLEATESERAAAIAAAEWFSEEELARFMQILLRTAGELRHGQQERLHFELALIKMLHAHRLTGVEEVLESLRGGGPKPEPGTRPGGGPAVAARPASRPTAAAAAAPVLAPPKASISAASVEPKPPDPFGAASARAQMAMPEMPQAVRPEPVAAAATPPPAEAGDPSAAVIRQLEQDGKASLLSMTGHAQWRWEENKLELVFRGEHAGLAALAGQPGARKALAAACTAALRRSPEIKITARPEEAAVNGAGSSPAAEPAALAGSPEERAQNHPLLRQLRERIPGNVLKTIAVRPQ